ncbi:YwqI/YxiC family protein [Peribacillus sp. NPDC096447]|uniref:YwqI/YxiC family protein n=1 Tax=Peribacillus sp. NPDC096447 TaxID=3364394 RepID=UPI00380EA2FE
MNEIKIDYGSVEKELSSIQMASSALNPALPESVAEKNELQLINTLEEINQLLEQVLQNYKALLAKTQSMAKNSVETMKEMDKRNAASFGPVPMR